jgi:hypothetical protein
MESRCSKPDDVKSDQYVEAWGRKETGRNAKTEMFSVNGIELRQQLECGGLAIIETRKQHR